MMARATLHFHFPIMTSGRIRGELILPPYAIIFKDRYRASIPTHVGRSPLGYSIGEKSHYRWDHLSNGSFPPPHPDCRCWINCWPKLVDLTWIPRNSNLRRSKVLNSAFFLEFLISVQRKNLKNQIQSLPPTLLPMCYDVIALCHFGWF